MVLSLRRNRDFMLLQAGQLLSSAGTESTTIAYPLLVLAETHSAGRAGVVAFARAVPWALFALPAGMAADQWHRKTLMIAADVIRAVAIAVLAGLVITDRITFWAIATVAFVEGAGTALFNASEVGALRTVVPAEQLPEAIATVTGRRAAVRVAGPSAGGALFGISKAFPFVADLVSYGCSTGSLLAMRTPLQEEREPDDASLRTRLFEGLRFLWGHPFLRTTTLLFGLGNFVAPGLLFSVVVIGSRHGLSSTEVGVLAGSFGVFVLIGSLLAGRVRRRLRPRAVLLLEMWCWPACGAFLFWPSPYVLAAGLIPPGLVIASTDSVVHTARLLLTPDRLVGRTNSAATTIGLAIAPLGPLVAGVLIQRSERATIAVFVTAALALAIWGTASHHTTPPALVGSGAHD